MLSEEENNAIAAKKEQQRASDAAVAAFLAGGGKVQVIAPGKSGVVPGSGGSMWGRGRKKATPEAAPVAELPQEEAEELEVEELAPLSSDDVFPDSPELFDLSDDLDDAEEDKEDSAK